MSAVYPQVVCTRVREQVSLELDSELSQLEQRMLAAHLERCAECAVYAADVRHLTERIRSAPLHTMRRPEIGAAAALALAALGLGTELAVTPDAPQGSLARFEGRPNLSPPRSVYEQEQAILRVVRVGRPLPPPGSVI